MTTIIIVGVVFAIILILLYSPKKKAFSNSSSASMSQSEGEEVKKNKGVIEKNSLKMMSYEDALEASKKFIYSITRLVLQRFSPGSQKEVMDAGRKLYESGAEYIHVVDIFSLSLQQSKTVKKTQSKNVSKGV